MHLVATVHSVTDRQMIASSQVRSAKAGMFTYTNNSYSSDMLASWKGEKEQHKGNDKCNIVIYMLNESNK